MPTQSLPAGDTTSPTALGSGTHTVVVLDLLEANIIDKGDQRTITETKDTTQQNKILHRCLKEKCTVNALRSVCAIIISIKGNPKMVDLGSAMRKRLDTGMCACMWCACERACVHAWVQLSVCDFVGVYV